MNCLEIQRQVTGSSSFSKLGRSAQKHLEHCLECQGIYPTRPLIARLLQQALPEVEPDRRLLAAVRQQLDQEMARPAWGFLRLDFSAFSFAAGVAALFVVLGLPLLWMGSAARSSGRAAQAVASVQRVQVRSELLRPWSNADPLLVTDSLTSLHREYRPQIRPGAVIHVIYPFDSKKQKARRAVVHY